MFIENIEIIKKSLLQYIGCGVYHILFLISLISILIYNYKNCKKNKKIEKSSIKDKNKKALLVGFSIIILLTILNPIFNKVIDELLNRNVYWRIFWMLPIGLNLAYLCTIIIKMVPDKTKKIILFTLLIFIISLSGKFIYTKENYSFYNNWYKIPDEYLSVINIISEVEVQNKNAMVSTDLMPYIRQIDAEIKVPYERRQYGDYDVYNIVKYYNSGDMKNLIQLCEEMNVNIIVYDKNIELLETPIDYGFDLYKQTERYSIYIK